MLEGLNSGGYFPFGVDDEIRPRGRELYSTACNNNSFRVPSYCYGRAIYAITLSYAGPNTFLFSRVRQSYCSHTTNDRISGPVNHNNVL